MIVRHRYKKPETEVIYVCKSNLIFIIYPQTGKEAYKPALTNPSHNYRINVNPHLLTLLAVVYGDVIGDVLPLEI